MQKKEPVITTDRLFLREMTENDFTALYAVLADSDIMAHYPYTFDAARVKGWIGRNIERYKEDGFGLWTVCLRSTGEMIGDCGLTVQLIDGQQLPEIGYHIRRDCQRKGYASEAAAAVADWAFMHTDSEALYSYCRQSNVPSIHTAEHIGMHFLKTYADADNALTHVSVLTRAEWRKKKQKNIVIEAVNAGNFTVASLDRFDRYQTVRNTYRLQAGSLVLRPNAFTDNWSPECKREKAAEILSGAFLTYCAFDSGRVVGEIMLVPELNKGRLIIDSFHVSRDCRRLGIGRMLFETAKTEAKRRGASALYLSACPAEETIRFYTAMGCVPSSDPIPVYAKDEPCDIQMECPLQNASGRSFVHSPHDREYCHMDLIKLVRPTVKYADQVMAFRNELFAVKDPDPFAGCAGLESVDSFSEWNDFEKRLRAKYGDGYVPSNVFLGVRQKDDRVVGIIDFRHPLSEFLLNFGGNIGYSIRPDERGKGYAEEMLRLLLPFCRQVGETRVLVVCDKENEASRRTILANGGVMENEAPDTVGICYSGTIQRYWIYLPETDEIKTKRLLLRRETLADKESIRAIWAALAKTDLAQYDRPNPLDEESVSLRAKKWDSFRNSMEHMFYVVCLGEDVIGFSALNRTEDGYELGYSFRPDMHGHGYAREAVGALLNKMRLLGVKRITAGTALRNTPSVRLLTALGFALTGTEQVSFYQDENGKDIVFEGGIFVLAL